MLNKEQILEIRKDFPYLNSEKNYVYFDNAATTQKPRSVIDSLLKYYEMENGNPHRGAHHFAIVATEVFENARDKVKTLLNASGNEEIIFLRNATEALNLIAYAWALENLKQDDEILLSIMEHHSNLVTWQFVAEKTGAKLKYLYLDENMQISDDEFNQKVSENTKLFTITLASNVVGTMPKVKEFIRLARKKSPNVVCIVDGAQYVPHHPVDVNDLNCDFLVFSGHKMLSAMGIGVLYGKKQILDSMHPFMYGGEMIEYVYEDRTTFAPSPMKFEAGTVNVSGAKSLDIAIDYINEIGMENIFEYESQLLDYAYEKMKKLDFIEIYTTSLKPRSPVLSFNFKEIHPHDVASILDSFNIAIRSGHHCTQPLHRKLGNNFSCRASFSFYNTFDEIDYFLEKLYEVRRTMGFGS